MKPRAPALDGDLSESDEAATRPGVGRAAEGIVIAGEGSDAAVAAVSGAGTLGDPAAPREPAEDPEADAGRPKSRRRKRLVTLLKAVVSIGLVAWILRGASVGEVLTFMGEASLPLLLLAFTLYMAGWLISVSRWRILLAAQGVQARYGFLLRSYLVAIFFNNLLPSTIGGDTVRIFDSWRLGKRKADAVTVIFVDRFLGMLALLLFALAATVGMRWLPGTPPLLPVWMGLAAAAFLTLTWMLFMPPARITDALSRLPLPVPEAVRSKLTRVVEAVSVFQGNRRALGKGLGLSLVLQTNVVFHYYLIAAALGFTVPLFAYFLIVPVALAVMALPISINAIGIRESVFAFFLGMFGVATVEAVAFTWVAYGLVLVQGLVGAVVYALRKESIPS